MNQVNGDRKPGVRADQWSRRKTIFYNSLSMNSYRMLAWMNGKSVEFYSKRKKDGCSQSEILLQLMSVLNSIRKHNIINIPVYSRLTST